MENQFLYDMGYRIYTRRRELEYTQELLADLVGVSVQMISNIECGKKAVRPENLAKICTALKTSADYILLGIKSAEQISGVSKKLAMLSEPQYKAIADLVDTIL